MRHPKLGVCFHFAPNNLLHSQHLGAGEALHHRRAHPGGRQGAYGSISQMSSRDDWLGDWGQGFDLHVGLQHLHRGEG